MRMAQDKTIRVLALMEATTVAGPAKNLIEFARRARQPEPGQIRAEISIVTFERVAARQNAFVQAAKEAVIPVIVLSERRRFDPGVVSQLRAAVLREQPDIIQSHNIKSHLLVRLLNLHREYPWMAFNHGYTAVDLKDRIYSQFDRWSLPAADRVVAVCGPFAQRLEQWGVSGKRLRVLHNSVNPFTAPPAHVIEPVGRALNIGDELMVLAVGRLSSEKGHRDLLHAVALLNKTADLPAFRVVLAGDGPEREPLLRLAAELGVERRLVMVGHQANVQPYYALATMLVLPSHTEGSPNVALEAMAAGLPVAATSVGGVPEILQHERTGLLVPPRDPAALAGAIRRLLQDERLRRTLGEAGRIRAGTDYTPEAYRRTLVALYQELLDERSAR
jgi:glycosyltransferase involved in cell wall biosynthesis